MSELTDIWADRRVNIGYETAEELAKCYNRENWRSHPENQRAATEDSLDTLGLIGQIKKSTINGLMFDGHLRVELALLKNPQMLLPVDYYDLNDDETALALQVHDATTEMAEPIADKLAALLERTRAMTADRPGLGAMLERLKERAGINGNGHQVTEDNPPSIDKAAELQKVWGVQVGDVWELGQHRLVCGDCTDRAVVALAIAPGEAGMMFTDPPYGVSYSAKNEYLNAIAKGNSVQTPIENDQQSEADLLPFLCSFLGTAKEAMKIGGVFYLCSPAGSTETVFRNALTVSGLAIRQEIVWYKNHFVLGRQDYQWIHETLLYGWKDGAAHFFYGGDRAQSTVWEIDRPHNSDLHPTGKPIELVERAIQNSSQRSDIIYDPFLGSGTTLVACEQLGRRCRAIELDPGYAAVSIQRFVDLTGITPKRIS